jgi:hypothetical protein
MSEVPLDFRSPIWASLGSFPPRVCTANSTCQLNYSRSTRARQSARLYGLGWKVGGLEFPPVLSAVPSKARISFELMTSDRKREACREGSI